MQIINLKIIEKDTIINIYTNKKYNKLIPFPPKKIYKSALELIYDNIIKTKKKSNL